MLERYQHKRRRENRERRLAGGNGYGTQARGPSAPGSLASAQPGDLALQPEDGLFQGLKVIDRQDTLVISKLS
jgi:hypothetical protein